FFALGIACPFLENESCSIHPDRPLICREHLVNTPAEWCAEPDRHPIRALPIVRADTAVARAFENERWVPLIDALFQAPPASAASGDARPMVESFVRALAAQAAEK
ncbi:MAG: YkgJ family cysteine cluster protein, partial [Bryobacterales bacterium]|nr:YkgJ family cysteine cluster protein [Bryobacterales bacterium]